MDFLTFDYLIALWNVILIDLLLAADNALVVGMAAAGLPHQQRARAILLGIAAATVLRIGFALVTTQLLQILGLMLAGGILLLWVAWKMWREIQADRARATDKENGVAAAGQGHQGRKEAKTFGQAALQIVLADVSMSLDNVLAVAGAAREHESVLFIGLVLSVAFMGTAATFIARLLQRFRWIAYVGLLVILWVALTMIWEGGHQVYEAAHTAQLF